jgi:hypothetical protein
MIPDVSASVSAGRDRHDEPATSGNAEGSSFTSHDDTTASWEQAWIDLGGEG